MTGVNCQLLLQHLTYSVASFLPAHFPSQPNSTPLIHSLTRENKNVSRKSVIARVRIHCPWAVVFK